jgi:putative ABC transport system permease protein
METLIQDLRYGLRSLIKNPGFAAVAIIALALGIGANTAIFSVVNGILFRPLPYPEPERLAIVWETRTNLQSETSDSNFPVAAGNFLDWREQNQTFDHIAAFHSQTLNLTGSGEPERIGVIRASADLFPLLGVEPVRGRTFFAEEDTADANRVVLLSHQFWQRRFGSDPNVLEQTLTLEGVTYNIIGVMPQGFQFPRKNELPAGYQIPATVDVWLPLALTPAQRQNRGRHYLAVVARLKSRVSQEQAQADMDSIARQLSEQYPQTNTDEGAALISLHQHIVKKIRPALIALLGAVGFVLLIACANVANLMLARAAARQKEVAVRVALGASRLRIVRQLLTESLLLAIIGGTLGFLLALWGIDVLMALAPDNIPRFEDLSIDGRVLGFTLLVSLATGILFGLVPALQVSKSELNHTLKEGGGRTAGSAQRSRIRSALMIAEIALSLVLLVGAGLMIRAFQRLMKVDPGFKSENVLTMDIAITRSKYPDRRTRSDFFEAALARISTVPGVEAAAGIYPLPLGGAEEGVGFTIENEPPRQPGDSRSVGPRWVSSDFFLAMGIPLRDGRTFDRRDSEDAPLVVIINDALAERYFPNENPIGKRVAIDSNQGNPNWRQIVGLVANIKHTNLEDDARPQLYIPHTQFAIPSLTFVVKTSTEPLALVNALREQVLAVDKDQPVTNIKTMDEWVGNALAQKRFNMFLFGVFAATALLLAAVGIYGVMAYSVNQRSHEIGIRLALGAQTGNVLAMVIRQGMLLALSGVGIGLIAAFALTRLLANLLFNVSTSDLTTFLAMSLILTGVALVACLVPARRATKVDPLAVLRNE